jgi:hypothetical protein
MKTSELTGPALDWAVAKCEGHEGERFMQIFKHQNKVGQGYCYSRDWAQGGPIIERELICIEADDEYEQTLGRISWVAHRPGDDFRAYWGRTPLIAAMRCYVASKLGDTADIPEELK